MARRSTSRSTSPACTARAGATEPPTQQDFDRLMRTNVLGAMQAIPQVAPLVEAAGGKLRLHHQRHGPHRGRGFQLRLGLPRQQGGPQHGGRLRAADYPKATLVAMSPGWVQTDMGGAGAPLQVQDSVAAMRATIAASRRARAARSSTTTARRSRAGSTMLLTTDQEMVRDAVRAFAQEQLWPHAAQWDKDHTFPREAHRGLAALGAYGICVPEQYGGAGLDYLTLALVLEEIAAGDGGTSTAISVTNCPVNAILMRYGSEAQKQRWLVPLAQGELLGAFCLTEPHVGSDASALRTTARKDGDGYVLDGVKQFITSGKNGHWPSSSPSPTRAPARRA
jgi:hypothetical protein